MSAIIHYGSINCQAKKKKDNIQCTNGAYWQVHQTYLCGVHSKGEANRVELPKLPPSIQKDNDLAQYTTISKASSYRRYLNRR